MFDTCLRAILILNNREVMENHSSFDRVRKNAITTNLGDAGADGAPPTPFPKIDGARFSKCELDSPDCRKLRISLERCVFECESMHKRVVARETRQQENSNCATAQMRIQIGLLKRMRGKKQSDTSPGEHAQMHPCVEKSNARTHRRVVAIIASTVGHGTVGRAISAEVWRCRPAEPARRHPFTRILACQCSPVLPAIGKFKTTR